MTDKEVKLPLGITEGKGTTPAIAPEPAASSHLMDSSHLTVPGRTETGRRSPKTLALSKPEFNVRLAAQMELLGSIMDLSQMVSTDAARCTHASLGDKLRVMDNRYNLFMEKHYAFIQDYSALLEDHAYMKDQVSRQVGRAHAAFREQIHQLKEMLIPERLAPTEPIAQLSIFGWLVLGPVQAAHAVTCTARTATPQPQDVLLQELFTKFWTQEEPPSDTPGQLTPEEEECEAHFRATHTRDSTGRYVVRIPLKLAVTLLGDSYRMAHRCLQQMLRRLTRDVDFRTLYHRFLEEYEELGHMVKAPTESPAGEVHFYLPHHGVLRPDRETTKLWVVFNGSAASTSGLSFNDISHTGAKLQLDIPDVLIWIRLHRCLFATDITKMFRQIQVHPDDWNLQRILWTDSQSNPVPYQLTTVTYGTKEAPWLSVRALLQLAEDEGHRFPLALPGLQLGRYVDDIFGGADTLDQLIEVAHQLTGLCQAGGFLLAKWHSTHQCLLTAVSSANTKDHLSLDDCATKILGIRWLPHEGRLVFSSGFSPLTGKLTKRIVLSEVAQIFDPLGFISPVTIRAKMFLQELWLHKVGWDEALSAQLSAKWLTLREDLTCLARLCIPRWLNTRADSAVELHGFSDVSQLAMSAVVYIVVSSPSTAAQAALVCSKTKVAPLKRLTIPRLELTAALLLTKLVKYVQATLHLDVTSTHLWTDSQVTLMWIRSHSSRWKDFVRNRVAQIQELGGDAQWRHVPGIANPADCASRGVTTAQLEAHPLWWTGPPWMTQRKDS